MRHDATTTMTITIATVGCGVVLVVLVVLEVAIRRDWHPVVAVERWLSVGHRRLLRAVFYVLLIPGVFFKARESGMATSTSVILAGGFLAAGVLMLIEAMRERSGRP
jgi:hypothetical protein